MNKITYKGNVKIISNDSNIVVVKKKNKDLKELFDYLSTRGFDDYPLIIDSNDEYNTFKYYENKYTNDPDIDTKFMKEIGILHYKTSTYKSVSRNKYKSIYNKLMDNIDYLKDYYSNLIESIDNERIMSPSSYLLARNYSIINSNLLYIEKELNNWFNLVKDKTKERVVIVHNNLSLDNLYVSDKLLFTGWDKYLVDTPIIDLYKLYKKEIHNINLISMFEIYNNEFKLTNEEIKLFYIMISLPNILEDTNIEYDKVKNIKSMLDYIYITNNFIKSDIFINQDN